MMLGDVIFNKVLSIIYGKDVWLKQAGCWINMIIH